MQSFREIVNRIKKLKNLKNDYDVANLLDIKRKTLAASINRNSLPYEKLVAYCNNERISLKWLLHNEGPIYIKDDIFPSLAEPPRVPVAEIPPSYEKQLNGIDPYLQAIADVKEIFDSEDPILIPAIQANLHAFKRAVKREQQFAQVLKENEELRNRMSTLEEKLISISSQFENLQTERKLLKTENNRLKSTYEGPDGDAGNFTNTNGSET